MKEVRERALDFNTYKGLQIPIPSPNGIAGMVWVAGPHFDDREIHKPVLHSLALHVFYRLKQLAGSRLHKKVCLTDREREVLAWASEGKTAWEIGCILSLSKRTIEWHFVQACKKLGAKNRQQAVALSQHCHSNRALAQSAGTSTIRPLLAWRLGRFSENCQDKLCLRFVDR